MSKEGFLFKFDPKACFTCKGNCCIGESGYIWANPSEIKRMADFLNMDFEDFIARYMIKVGFRFSLKEKPFDGGFACIFFDEQNLRCGIYDARPSQCKTFPFWDYFKANVEEAKKECPGILV
ncbi:MAG: zinc/iron-chelating domain-containing protein [Proteobacteria bacterium]|nr:MAG: zinc/iron-chelating domain-containing protein [Pseudomonadota bacterium]